MTTEAVVLRKKRKPEFLSSPEFSTWQLIYKCTSSACCKGFAKGPRRFSRWSVHSMKRFNVRCWERRATQYSIALRKLELISDHNQTVFLRKMTIWEKSPTFGLMSPDKTRFRRAQVSQALRFHNWNWSTPTSPAVPLRGLTSERAQLHCFLFCGRAVVLFWKFKTSSDRWSCVGGLILSCLGMECHHHFPIYQIPALRGLCSSCW